MHLDPGPFSSIPINLSSRSPRALPQLISVTPAEALSYLSPRESLAVASASGGSLNFLSSSSLNLAASGSDWTTSLQSPTIVPSRSARPSSSVYDGLREAGPLEEVRKLLGPHHPRVLQPRGVYHKP